MNKRFGWRMLTGAIAVSAILWAGGTAIAVEKLTAVYAFPKGLVYTQSFLDMVKLINERGKGVVEIELRGGPEAIGQFEQGAAVRDGVVDMMYGPGSFYGAAVPEIDAIVASHVSPMEARKNGGLALMDQAHQKRMGAKYLAWIDAGIQFHIYMVNDPKIGADGIPDLSGVKMRDNPIYHAFFGSLNATTASIKSPEVYAAFEKGVVDATAWTSIGLRQLKWDKFLKYRINPGFYQTDIGVIVNLDAWNRLSDKAKKIIQDTAIEWEEKSLNDRNKERVEEEAALKAGGMKFVDLPKAGATKYIKLADDAAWARMKERMEKMGGMENYDKLRKAFGAE